jgi:hypothetical protein
MTWKYRKPAVIAQDIKMMRPQHKGSILVLEGPTDIKLFKELTSRKDCMIFRSNGKGNTLKIIQKLEEDHFSGALAIVDADFWLVDQIEPSSVNILVTDTTDVESMIIFSDAFERVLEQFTSFDGNQEVKISILRSLVSAALPIGLFRLLSMPNHQNFQLNFKELEYEKFINFKNLEINLEKMINFIKTRSRNSKVSTSKTRGFLKKMIEQGFNETEICTGEDLLKIFGLWLLCDLGNRQGKQITFDTLSASLYLAYNTNYFQLSSLYSNIKKWEDSNRPFKVLK